LLADVLHFTSRLCREWIEELSHKFVRDSGIVDVVVQSTVVGDASRVNDALALGTYPAKVHDEVKVFAEVVLPRVVLEEVLSLPSDREVWT
jgi:hypothetical protein